MLGKIRNPRVGEVYEHNVIGSQFMIATILAFEEIGVYWAWRHYAGIKFAIVPVTAKWLNENTTRIA